MKSLYATLLLTALYTQSFADTKVSAYGFGKISYLSTSREFDADHKPIGVASTNGKTSQEESLMTTSRSQFTAKHSRFGMNVDNSLGIKLKFEFDLDGENGNRTGVATSDSGILRVRQANLAYQVSESGTLTIGKKWDIFSPLMPHTYQVTTIQLWSGNTGFITDGIDYTHKVGSATLAAELKNIGADSTTIKLSGPAATIRADYKISDQLIGFSALAGSLEYKKQDVTAPYDDRNRSIEGYNLYYNGKFIDQLDIVAEYYSGKNLGGAMVGALAQASKAQASVDAKGEESGYYVSLKYKFEKSAIYGGLGQAEFEDESLAANHSRTGLVSNELSRFGYEQTLMENVTLYLEGAHVNSGYYENSRVKKYNGTYYDLGLMARF